MRIAQYHIRRQQPTSTSNMGHTNCHHIPILMIVPSTLPTEKWQCNKRTTSVFWKNNTGKLTKKITKGWRLTSVLLFFCQCCNCSCWVRFGAEDPSLREAPWALSPPAKSFSSRVLQSNGLQRPKSDSLKWPYLSSSRLSGLMSLQQMKCRGNNIRMGVFFETVIRMFEEVQNKWSNKTKQIATRYQKKLWPVYIVMYMDRFYSQNSLRNIKSGFIFS